MTKDEIFIKGSLPSKFIWNMSQGIILLYIYIYIYIYFTKNEIGDKRINEDGWSGLDRAKSSKALSKEMSQMIRVSIIFFLGSKKLEPRAFESSLSFSILRERNLIYGANKGACAREHPTTPSRKLLAHVQLPCEQKRESLLGANSVFSLPLGSSFTQLTRRERDTEKNDLRHAFIFNPTDSSV